MHKLYEWACDELAELENKAEKGLSAAELEYAVKLTELKKNILKNELLEGESEYSGNYDTMRSYRRDRSYGDGYNGGSYAGRRYARRDSMGRYSSEDYSRAADDVIGQLEDMLHTAPNERSKTKIRELISEMQKV